MAHRLQRFSSTLKQCLADILKNDIADPRLGMVFITEIIMSDDLKRARIFISHVGGETDAALQSLNRAKGFIKRALAKKMYLKYVPEILFLQDETLGITPSDNPEKGSENEEADR